MSSQTITRWIISILNEISNLKDTDCLKIMENCGKECSRLMGTAAQATEIRKNTQNKNDIDLLLKTFKENVFPDSPLYRESDTIYVEYTHESCECPVVVEAGISNPMMCNCTRGHTKAIFEALFDRPVEVRLEKSILMGDKICKQAVLFI